MHFPASFKLIGVALLSAFVTHAAPKRLDTQITITELTDFDGRIVWEEAGGYLFTFIKNLEPLARNDMKHGLQIAKYKTNGWEEDGAPIEPVFAFTVAQTGVMLYNSELPKDIYVLTSGFFQEHYWVIWTPKV